MWTSHNHIIFCNYFTFIQGLSLQYKLTIGRDSISLYINFTKRGNVTYICNFRLHGTRGRPPRRELACWGTSFPALASLLTPARDPFAVNETVFVTHVIISDFLQNTMTSAITLASIGRIFTCWQ